MPENKIPTVEAGQTWTRDHDGFEIRIFASQGANNGNVKAEWWLAHPVDSGTTFAITDLTLWQDYTLAQNKIPESEFCVLHTVDNPVVIGVGGYKTSGKDVFARALEGKTWRRRGMSDPLLEWTLKEDPWIRITHADPIALTKVLQSKHEMYALMPRLGGQVGWIIRASGLIEVLGYEEAKRVEDYRVYLMKIGTEAGRTIIGEDVWADYAETAILGDLAMGHNVVITGIRYQNEMDMIHRLGGTSVWVDRPAITKVHEALVAAKDHVAGHSSEVSLKATDFDIVTLNDGTLEEFTRKAELLGNHIFSNRPIPHLVGTPHPSQPIDVD